MVKMSVLTDLQIQYNPNQNSKKVFWRFHTSQFYMEHVYEKELGSLKKCWKRRTNWFQGLPWSCSSTDSVNVGERLDRWIKKTEQESGNGFIQIWPFQQRYQHNSKEKDLFSPNGAGIIRHSYANNDNNLGPHLTPSTKIISK